MHIDSLVIVEKNHQEEPCLFVSPLRPDGEMRVHTERTDAWLEMGPFRVALSPTAPLVLRGGLGRHPLTIHAGERVIPLFIHVDTDGDRRVELCVQSNDRGVAQATLLSHVASTGREAMNVCFQTQPQGLATTVHVWRKGQSKPDVVELPKGRPFETLSIPRGDFPLQVRIAEALVGDQVGGTEQVDIIVE